MTKAIEMAGFKVPGPGEGVEVAEGVLWARLPLPTRLNHVNVYLLEDGPGWTVVDTGMAAAGCVAAWELIIEGALRGRPITRVICTHFHRDHVGMVGWLSTRFAFKLYMSQAEYLISRVYSEAKPETGLVQEVDFFTMHGLSRETAEAAARVRITGRSETAIPGRYEQLRAGDVLRVGARDWRVLTGPGHSVEQVMLYACRDRLFLSADQVLPQISPNISVGSMAPAVNPLHDFIASLIRITSEVDDSVLVLPGHQTPFSGLHRRAAELVDHHAGRCASLLDACSRSPLCAAELIPVIFGRSFGTDVLAAAVGEVVAHINYLVGDGRLQPDCREGIARYCSK